MTRAAPRVHVLTKGASERVEYVVTDKPVDVGRAAENTICLHDSLVSRHHAKILYDGEALVIEDVGGKNPIRVNGDEIQGRRSLDDGDQVTIGQTEMLIDLGSGGPTPLRVIPDESGRQFHPGAGGLSLDSATILFDESSLTDPATANRVNSRLSRLYQLSADFLAANDEEELFDQVISAATQETSAERGFLALSSDESGDPESLEVVRFWDPEKGGEARQLEMSETILNHIQREQQAVLVRDVPDQQDFGVSVIDLKIHSFVGVPITHRDKSLGLIYVDTRGSSADQFDRSDLEFISAIGRMAGMALENIRIHSRLQRENEKLRSMVGRGDELIGSSEAMKRVLSLVDRVAPRDASILIQGENGTGKELVARAIHTRSSRKDEPFVAVNCAAIPPHLVESELFGYEKGAFTGAHERTDGKFDLADKGTLFLDEIGEMPLDMQVKILRALQERTYYPVGGKEERSVDIRVISATNRDLRRSVEEGTFREDLYFRLAVITVDVPPLRDRGEDAIEIAKRLLTQDGTPCKLTKAAEDCLRNYSWPGNVRELRNALEQAIILGDGKRIGPSDLPPQVGKTGRGKMVFRLKSLADIEQQYIERVLEETNGNKARAASILGISRETLYQKLKLYREGAASS